MAAKFTIEVGLTAFRLMHQDGSEGELADFGLPSILTSKSGVQYMALYEPGDEDENPPIPDTQEVYTISRIPDSNVEIQEVEFEGEDGELEGDDQVVVGLEEVDRLGLDDQGEEDGEDGEDSEDGEDEDDHK